MAKPIPVYIESGDKKVFACAVGYPGWCRSGKDEASALEALADYAPRSASAMSVRRALMALVSPSSGWGCLTPMWRP